MNLSTKIISSIMILMSVLVAALTWQDIAKEESMFERLVEDRAKAITNIISMFSIERLLIKEYLALEVELSNIGEKTTDIISITVTHNEKIVASYQADTLDTGHIFIKDIYTDSHQLKNKKLGQVQLILSTSTFNRLLEGHKWEKIWSGVLSLVILFVAMVFLLRVKVLRRIEILTKYSQIIAKAHGYTKTDEEQKEIVENFLNSHHKFLDGPSDEIGQLAKTLRTMSRSIGEKEALLLKAKDRSEAANEAKSAFLSTMSHEIRTPMNAILGMGELLSESGLDETQKHYLGVLQRNGESLLYLIDDILDFSRVESGKIILESTRIDLNEMVKSVVDNFQLEAGSRFLKIVGIVATDVDPIRIGDPIRLRQLLMNLVGNSVKFTPEGVISIYVQSNIKKQDSLTFSVSDTGIGIPAEKQSVIFDVFTQGDSTTTRKYGGSGLGLTICARLIKLMGGEIKVNSKEGKGSEFQFTVDLPQLKNKNKTSQFAPIKDTQPKKPRMINSDSKLKILLVEDSQDNILLFKAYLKNGSCKLDTAVNGLEAVEKFKENQYDLVFMDIQMPLMDGYSATKAIRKLEVEMQRKRTPILALTAYVMEEEIKKMMLSGCDLHLKKPIRKKLLLDVISKFSND
ncbi:MAG: response regulator [Magnetococcales bacterium]|nr:response regulator [Magnetococcales bacterium]